MNSWRSCYSNKQVTKTKESLFLLYFWFSLCLDFSPCDFTNNFVIRGPRFLWYYLVAHGVWCGVCCCMFSFETVLCSFILRQFHAICTPDNVASNPPLGTFENSTRLRGKWNKPWRPIDCSKGTMERLHGGVDRPLAPRKSSSQTKLWRRSFV